jgi:hypothetical protein
VSVLGGVLVLAPSTLHVLQLRRAYSHTTFSTLKFSYVAYYNRNVNSGFGGQHFRNEMGVALLIEPPLKSSPNDKMLPLFKRGGALCLLIQLTNLETYYFVMFLGSFAS